MVRKLNKRMIIILIVVGLIMMVNGGKKEIFTGMGCRPSSVYNDCSQIEELTDYSSSDTLYVVGRTTTSCLGDNKIICVSNENYQECIDLNADYIPIMTCGAECECDNYCDDYCIGNDLYLCDGCNFNDILTCEDYCVEKIVSGIGCSNPVGTCVECVANNDCDTGEECVDNWCEPSGGCSDTDSGQNYNVKGTVTVGSNTYTDSCAADKLTLTEYYCSSGSKSEEAKDCKEVYGMWGCADGKCVECIIDTDCVAKYEDGYACNNNICELTANTCADYPTNYGSCSLTGGSTCTADKTAILSGCSDLDPSSAYVYCWTQKTNCLAGKYCIVQNLQASCVNSPQCTTNIDCNDGNECTNDICSSGVCTYSNKVDGTSCSSGGGVCNSGYCSLFECSDGQTQQCTIDGCTGTRTCTNHIWGSCVKNDPNCGNGDKTCTQLGGKQCYADTCSSLNMTSISGASDCTGSTPYCCKAKTVVSDKCTTDDDCMGFIQECKNGECKMSGTMVMIIAFFAILIAFKSIGGMNKG